MKDRYTNRKYCLDRLKEQYDKYGSLYIAFDYDDTIVPCYYERAWEGSCPKVIKALQEAKENGFRLILFTCREGKKLDEAIKNAFDLKIGCNYINESPIIKDSQKPYYNLFLDDKAGLGEALWLLKQINKYARNKSDNRGWYKKIFNFS